MKFGEVVKKIFTQYYGLKILSLVLAAVAVIVINVVL